ncbi:hypothetical protein J3R30DRAFT_3580199 [Lentinula aciculospora]|uniref:BZIP domain-containing protein n=1 Tax=Lentinula aciculospora TaxID=153920 RepID=A0A9W8ZU75_9AGAR|nr:hypothetical protein J3R30DRAFT_3580199 [Lentinula aciculospora]
MLVDPVNSTNNPCTSTPTNMDLEEYLNTELFGPSSVAAMSPGHPGSSRASSPSSHSDSLSQILSTPPQPVENSFPAVDPYSFLTGLSGVEGNHNFGFEFGSGSGAPSFFNFLDEEMKVDPSSNPMSFEAGTPFDFMSALGIGGVSGLTIDPSASSSSPSGSGSGSVAMAIDPQLVDSPSTRAQSDFGDEEDKEEKTEHSVVSIIDDEKKTRSHFKSISSKTSEDTVDVTKEAKEKLTVTITPVKVGGHGKARKGTVQSGGVTKKVTISSSAFVPAAVPVPLPTIAAPLTTPYFPSNSATSLLSRNKENVSAASPSSSTTSNAKGADDKDDDDDLPADWHPPPEVFAKMSSKEKRQLRNKISARNFRVRRKEYISTLEMDIAERDRLLQAIRSELGSTQSENSALRQEVAALKKALLEGRGTTGISPISPSSSLTSIIRSASPTLSIRGADVNLNSAALTTGLTIDDLNLPPPAPLPERSAAEELALRAAAAGASPSASTSNASTSNLIIPNTQKDLPTSPRLNNNAGFWGGVSQAGFGFGGMGGGFTPVHTVLMPDLNTNMNVDGTNISIGQWVRDVLAANAANSRDDPSSPEGSPRPLQENINPVMNVSGAHQEDNTPNATAHNGFEGFVDTNPFTMKTLDAYRMQLWTKMAASSSQASHSNQFSPSSPPQQSPQPNIQSSSYAQQRKALERELSSSSPFTLPSHQPSAKHPHSRPPHNLTTSLKPAYFVNSNKPNLPSQPPPRMGNTLSALLAGKHSPPSVFGTSFAALSAYSSPATSSNPGRAASSKQQQQQQMQQAQNAMYAALASTASQTLMRRLGSAFWDAFSGSSPGTSSSGLGMKPWDADKVMKVLEGKAVIKVVDVDEPAHHMVKREPLTPKLTPSSLVLTSSSSDCDKNCSVTALLEESMRSLTLSKK